MTKQEIIDKVTALSLPMGQYVVFGSCPLAVAGIRESNDIDMLVSPELLEQFKKQGWVQVDKGKDDNPYALDVFEAHSDWKFSAYNPTLEHLLASATIVNNIPFASLDEVRKWKVASGRPKDLQDIKLIDAYQARQG